MVTKTKATKKSATKKTSTKKASAKASTKATSKKATKTTKKKATASGDLPYPELKVKAFDAFTCDQAKDLLGYVEEEESGEKFGFDFVRKTYDGTKVRFLNNDRNRNYNQGTAQAWAYTILEGRWKQNGETWIVGKSGNVISCQHRADALIIANEIWAAEPEMWPAWDSPPTMPAIIVFGVDEDDEVVNTIDTGRPRTLADVIYRSSLFMDLPRKQRDQISKMMEKTIQMFADRTGAFLNAFAPRRTHVEYMAVLDQHPRLIECVKEIYKLDEERNVSKLINPGYAAALFYLMATSESDAMAYHEGSPPSEKLLNFDNWDLAWDFWNEIGVYSPNIKGLFKSLAALQTDEDENPLNVSVAMRCSLIAKAWEKYEAPQTKINKLSLKFDVDDMGFRSLAEFNLLGGIDAGSPAGAEEFLSTDDDPSPEEIAERAAEVRKGKGIEEDDEPEEDEEETGEETEDEEESEEEVEDEAEEEEWEFEEGQLVIVNDGEEPWPGEILMLDYEAETAQVSVREGHPLAGQYFECNFADLEIEEE